MQNFLKYLLFLFVIISFSISCTDNDDDLYKDNGTEVQNFIWKGLNNYYLWQQNVPDLADSRFANPYLLNSFIASKGSPEKTFQSLLFKPASLFTATAAVDRYSVINDYKILENAFQGIRITSGMMVDYKYVSGNSGPLFGIVRYVLPNSDAANKNVKRGDIFYAINGTSLTNENRGGLLDNNNFTIDLAVFTNGNLTPNGVSIALIRSQIIENPVYITKTFTIGSKKIGYLMYNGFTANFDSELNNAFGQLAGSNISDLVLDLRYNGGGSVQTASYLASMITGQFTNQVFAKKQWNPRLQAYWLEKKPETLTNYFRNNIRNVAINSLNLSKIYILTSDRTASASELLINGLKPYINVIQIGAKTVGKNVGSIILYDSPDFSKSNVNPNHKYGMLPLVLKIVNKDNFGDYEAGFSPIASNTIVENVMNFGILGDANEPLLKKALDLIGFRNRNLKQNSVKIFENVENDSKDLSSEMYLDKLPKEFENFSK